IGCLGQLPECLAQITLKPVGVRSKRPAAVESRSQALRLDEYHCIIQHDDRIDGFPRTRTCVVPEFAIHRGGRLKLAELKADVILLSVPEVASPCIAVLVDPQVVDG